MITTHHSRRGRRGVSLIEVIACTALVAIMIVPIAGVIRASGQSIVQASGGGSTEARLRTALRWVAQTVRDSDVLAVGRQRLTIRLPDSSTGSFEIRRGDLVFASGGSQTVLAESVRDIQFSAVSSVSPPVSQTGVAISLRARNESGDLVTVDATVAQPPQF